MQCPPQECTERRAAIRGARGARRGAARRNARSRAQERARASRWLQATLHELVHRRFLMSSTGRKHCARRAAHAAGRASGPRARSSRPCHARHVRHAVRGGGRAGAGHTCGAADGLLRELTFREVSKPKSGTRPPQSSRRSTSVRHLGVLFCSTLLTTVVHTVVHSHQNALRVSPCPVASWHDINWRPSPCERCHCVNGFTV